MKGEAGHDVARVPDIQVPDRYSNKYQIFVYNEVTIRCKYNANNLSRMR